MAFALVCCGILSLPHRQGFIKQLIRTAGTLTLFAAGVLPVAGAGAVPTFTKEVAPILFKNCAKCHRSGGIASSASFLTYETTRPWAKSIKERVTRREMPPWSADPNGSVKFSNDARLPQEDIDTLAAWVNAGAPKGNDADLLAVPKFEQGWLHPKGLAPDLVVSMPGDFQVPANGEIPYVRFLAKVPLPENKWIAALQLLPSNPKVVHHMAITEVALADGLGTIDLDVFARLSRELGLRNPFAPINPAVAAPGNPAVYDVLGVYTPGTTFEMFGADSAKLLKGGTNLYINFNIHYTTTGKLEKDRSLMGLWFQPQPPKHQVFRAPAGVDTIIADGKELLTDTPGKPAEGTAVVIPPIPPYAENYEIIGITAYTEPVTIYQFQPHAHVRCKDFKYAIVYPDGREEVVLTIPKYDFNWQLAYQLATPLKLPAGGKLVVTAHYDNSPSNRRNPAPDKEVFFREMNQSWDEMFTPFIQYSFDSQDLSNLPKATGSQRQTEGKAAETPERTTTLDVAEVVGCLRRSSDGKWLLANAGDSIVSKTQSTSSLALKAAETRPLGNEQYELLGLTSFNPSTHQGRKVSVKGVLIKDFNMSRLNVTSLQKVSVTCLE